MKSSRRIIICVVALLAWGGANLFAWTYLERRERRMRAEKVGVPYEIASRFEERIATVFDNKGDIRGSMSYRLFQPPHMELGRLHPVILFLHGAGERGSDNLRQLSGIPGILSRPKLQSEFPCFLVVPQCPEGIRWSNRSALDDEKTCDGLAVALAAVDEVLAEYPADPDRVYLIGFSMGGFGAWELAARRPERFAAVVPIAGGGDPAWAPRLAEISICVVHGEADEAVPVSASEEMVVAVRAAGGSARFEKISGASHGCWREFLAEPGDFMRWLCRRRR